LTHNIHKIQERRGLYTQHIGRRGLDTQHIQNISEKGSLHTRYRKEGVFTHKTEVLTVNIHNKKGRNGLDAKHTQQMVFTHNIHNI